MENNKKHFDKFFDGQRDDEEFLFIFRRHIISMRKGFYLFLGIFALSIIPLFIFMTMDMLWVVFGGFMLGFMLFLYHFSMWYFSVFVVTSQRIRQISQKGFFQKEVMDLPLSKIQTINYKISGMAAEIFKFGTINILTMVGDLTIKNVENPSEIYDKLQNAIGNLNDLEEYER